MIGRRFGRTEDIAPAPAPAPAPPGPPPGTQLLSNSDFLLGTSGWTAQASSGFATYSASSANRPAITNSPTNPSGFPSNGYLIFSFPSAESTENVYQIINISGLGGINSITTEANVLSLRNKVGPGIGPLDVFKLTVEFRNASGTVLSSMTTGNVNPPGISMDRVTTPLTFTNYALTLNRSSAAYFDNIRSIKVTLYGYDPGYWNGNFGPVVDSCFVTVN